MDGEYIVSTDKKEKIKLESRILSAYWMPSSARGDAEAELKVKTVFVAEGSPIEIKGRSSQGKAPDTIKGKISNDAFVGKLLIPEKVKIGADIWFEAKLPKHGLKMESNAIPAKPAIKVSKIGWDRKEVKRGDEVTLTCQFASGVEDEEEASIIIYEHNPNSYDFKVTALHATIVNNQIEAKWLFDYKEDTAQIAHHSELQPVGKSYQPPQYFFVVVVESVKIGDKRESGLLRFQDCKPIELLGTNGNPVPNEKYTLHLPDGTSRSGTLDANGQSVEHDIPPGSIHVEFPDYDIPEAE